MWVVSPWGKVECRCRYSEAVHPGTVWTWNAIGKAPGAWRLDKRADEATLGFLLNPLITEELPEVNGLQTSNSDPITGQAGWYDVRVKIITSDRPKTRELESKWPTMARMPGTSDVPSEVAFFAGRRK